MCVCVDLDTEKVVKLPPYVVTASRISDIALELTLARISMVWNQNIGMFDVINDGQEVKIVTEEQAPKKSKPNEQRRISKWKEISQTLVNGRVVVTVEFTFTDGSIEYTNYIIVDGRYWYNLGTDWYSIPGWDSGDGGWSQEPGGLPAGKITPPSGAFEGGGNQMQD